VNYSLKRMDEAVEKAEREGKVLRCARCGDEARMWIRGDNGQGFDITGPYCSYNCFYDERELRRTPR
jgi:hypothetical protein